MNQPRNQNWILGLLLALMVLTGVLDFLGYLTPVRSAVQTIFRPAQAVLTTAAGRVSNLTEQRATVTSLQTENADLREEVNRLTIENVQLQELERENQQLRELLNYTRNNPGVDYTTAGVVGRIIGSDPSNLLYTIIVDAGAQEGIARDMPVINSRGLVGRVTEVGPNWSQVLLLIDPVSSVNVVIQNKRIEGIVRGELGGTLIMERIPQGVTVSAGDLVLTSGLGGQMPPKLVVGQVTEVFQRDLDLFQTAFIRPTVNFRDLESVLILTAFQPIDFEEELLNNSEVGN